MGTPNRSRNDSLIARACAMAAGGLVAFALDALADVVAPMPERPVAPAATPATVPLPARLADTGLFVAGSTTQVADTNVAFAPQYPLWSDGTTKRRWLYIPPGTAIDARDPDAWEFPRGTRLWKEFSYGRRVETRFIERLADGSWRFATYLWNDTGTDAALAPADGVAALPVATAPGGRYAVPSQADCRACHEGAAVPVLGASALQLSPDRDPLAPHAGADDDATRTDLRSLVARGWLVNLPRELLANPPRIAARSPQERAALGYLHGNCGHCHNDAADGAVPVGVRLAQRAGARDDGARQVLESLFGASSRYRGHGAAKGAQVVVPGDAARSVLVQRMRSRDARVQMPPLGTQLPDATGLALIERWIERAPASTQASRPARPVADTHPTTSKESSS